MCVCGGGGEGGGRFRLIVGVPGKSKWPPVKEAQL